jgi:hypothetical protein
MAAALAADTRRQNRMASAESGERLAQRAFVDLPDIFDDMACRTADSCSSSASSGRCSSNEISIHDGGRKRTRCCRVANPRGRQQR